MEDPELCVNEKVSSCFFGKFSSLVRKQFPALVKAGNSLAEAPFPAPLLGSLVAAEGRGVSLCFPSIVRTESHKEEQCELKYWRMRTQSLRKRLR